jgi:hypothetical protein
MEYGVVTWIVGRPEAIDRDMDAVAAGGYQWMKIAVHWDMIEHACNDCYDFSQLDPVINAAAARGLKVIARVDHPPAWATTNPNLTTNPPPDNLEDYADIISALTAHYTSNYIQAIEIWNEPNLNREWGNLPITQAEANKYMFMLRRSYEEAKKKDPNITILSAGLSPTGTNDGTAQPDDVYLQWLYQAGLGQYSDGIGLNANSYGLPPETPIMSDPSRPHPSFYFRRIEQMHDIMVANGDVNKQVWILECGYDSDPIHPDYAWFAVDEATKGDYLVRALKYAKSNWSPWVAEMTVWTFADPAWTQDNEQYWWAITNPDGSTRPAYDAIQAARANGSLP